MWIQLLLETYEIRGWLAVVPGVDAGAEARKEGGPVLNMYEMSEEALEEIIITRLNQPKYRAKQIRKCEVQATCAQRCL